MVFLSGLLRTRLKTLSPKTEGRFLPEKLILFPVGITDVPEDFLGDCRDSQQVRFSEAIGRFPLAVGVVPPLDRDAIGDEGRFSILHRILKDGSDDLGTFARWEGNRVNRPITFRLFARLFLRWCL